MGEKEELKARFIKAFASLPEPEITQIIAIVDGKPISWEKAYAEISNDTQLGFKILEKMKKLGIL